MAAEFALLVMRQQPERSKVDCMPDRSLLYPASAPSDRLPLSFLLMRADIWYRVAIVLTAACFLHSLFSAGPVWDEVEEFGKASEQFALARRNLSGAFDQTFQSLSGDHAFYGLGTIFLPYVLSELIDLEWLGLPEHNYAHSYSVILHILTFLCAVACAEFTRRLTELVTGHRDTGLLAGTTLLLTPFWMGYGFFDYKDVPVALGVIAATYFAAFCMQDRNSRTSLCFFLALVFIGLQKFASIALALPACLAFLIGACHEPSFRRFRILTLQALGCLLLLYLATPPAWTAPFSFAVVSAEYSSQHSWGGCTLTASQCIGREFNNGNGYSVLKYLGIWYAVKLPVLIGVGLIAATGLYIRKFLRSSWGQHLVIGALVWPIVAIAVRNSTLYDSIRHTLFLVPLAVVAVFVILPPDIRGRHRWWVAGYFLFLFADSLKLQPYQYVWFNEVARFVASEKNFETDYWGYSLREAVAKARTVQGPTDWIVGNGRDMNPGHLVRLFATERFADEAGRVPPGSAYLDVRTTRTNSQPPANCPVVWSVARRELLAPKPINLSVVARCEGSLPSK